MAEMAEEVMFETKFGYEQSHCAYDHRGSTMHGP